MTFFRAVLLFSLFITPLQAGQLLFDAAIRSGHTDNAYRDSTGIEDMFNYSEIGAGYQIKNLSLHYQFFNQQYFNQPDLERTNHRGAIAYFRKGNSLSFAFSGNFLSADFESNYNIFDYRDYTGNGSISLGAVFGGLLAVEYEPRLRSYLHSSQYDYFAHQFNLSLNRSFSGGLTLILGGGYGFKDFSGTIAIQQEDDQMGHGSGHMGGGGGHMGDDPPADPDSGSAVVRIPLKDINRWYGYLRMSRPIIKNVGLAIGGKYGRTDSNGLPVPSENISANSFLDYFHREGPELLAELTAIPHHRLKLNAGAYYRRYHYPGNNNYIIDSTNMDHMMGITRSYVYSPRTDYNFQGTLSAVLVVFGSTRYGNLSVEPEISLYRNHSTDSYYEYNETYLSFFLSYSY